MKQSKKQECREYLGNRGIDESILKCDKFKDIWFIVFKHTPNEVEISQQAICYEAFDHIPIENMKWTQSFYKKIKREIKEFHKKGTSERTSDSMLVSSFSLSLARSEELGFCWKLLFITLI